MAEQEQTTVSDLSLAVKNEANLVAAYASKLLGDERAQEFAARVSLLAKTEPKIAEAIVQAPDSFLTAMMACVHLDLMPNTPQQFAYIIPFRNNRLNRMEVQFQPGYKGLILLARRSGEIKKIRPSLVYKGDKFVYKEGLELTFEHEPNWEVDRNNYENITHAYVVAKLPDDEYQVVVMSKGEIEKVRQQVKDQNGGKEGPAWQKWPERQALKTVLKFATKQLPSSSEEQRKSLTAAAQLDSLAEVGKLKFNPNTGEFESDTSTGQSMTSEERRAKMAAAEAKRKEFSASDFQPKAIPTGIEEPEKEEK